MTEEPQVELYQADLDDATYGALLDDLAALSRPLVVSVKRAAQGYVEEDAGLTLARARELLEAGAVRALQVRYEHEGGIWIDTVLRTPLGARLVRVRAPGEQTL